MFILLSLFLCVYGSLHLYVLIKARRAFYLQNLGYLLTVLLLTFLMLTPILSRVWEAQGYIVTSIVLAWIGNVWMGYLFYFVCLSLPLDGYHLGLAGLQHIGRVDLTHLMLSRRQRVVIMMMAALLLTVYGAVEAHRIVPQTLTLKSAKIPASMKGLRVVQITDLHIGPMTFPARIQPVINAVNAAQPDILVSTGDLVDGHMPFRSTLISALSGISAPLGKFAVTGNHEYYTGLEDALEFTRQAGFSVLRNQHVLVKDLLAIVGMDDTGHDGNKVSEAEILDDLANKHFTLLLKHRPVVNQDSLNRFDLQLSGHTHKGQMYPFTLLVDMFFALKSGTHKVSELSRIHVSRGTGTWGPPFRVLAPPEVTIINLLPADAPSQ